MNVTNSIADFFQGSPFSNPVGSLIEKATDSRNEIENWTLFMEICDVINSMEDGPKLAIRAIKRLIATEITKDPVVVLYALTLLETCVKNCGYRFQLVVFSRDFLQELEKIILSSINQNKTVLPGSVRQRILFLLQNWYHSFRGQPDLKEIEIIYMNLVDFGVQFPLAGSNTVSPIKKSQITAPKTISSDSDNVALQASTVIASQQPLVNISSEHVIDKLSKDLQIVQSNIDVMCQLINEYPVSENIEDDALSLIKNLYEINSEMQNRLLKLINGWEETQLKDSSILFDMLRVNDEMNSALAQYGRFERAIGSINNSEGIVDKQGINFQSDKLETFGDHETKPGCFSDSLGETRKSAECGDQKNDEFPEEIQKTIFTENNLQFQTAASRSAISALSSQEFDQFLSEQSRSSLSTNSNNKNCQVPVSQKDKSKEKSQLLDM